MQYKLFPEIESQKSPETKVSNAKGEVLVGDSLEVLKTFSSQSFQCCITSPPYWGLRDYGIKEQIGAETNLADYISRLVEIFEEVRRVLYDNGTLWLNIGDSYTSGGRTWRDSDKKNPARGMDYRAPTPEGLKPKDLIGVPWRLAFALQEAGWYLRSDIIWSKNNGHPESVKDRPSRIHEYIFLMTKSEKYFYNYEDVKEPGVNGKKRNCRSVWNINTEGFKDAHFATFPRELVTRCLLACQTQLRASHFCGVAGGNCDFLIAGWRRAD
jgi:site-specific DNA-methyltransferase (adenine-specific)/site-specific DNA-methyltransferase (cytosine-N4-specific)